MRAVSLHADVLVVTSSAFQTNCLIVRGDGTHADAGPSAGAQAPAGSPITVIAPRQPESQAAETFVIDSPVLPDELDAIASLVAQAGFPPVSGLLATHGDWDHLLGRSAFPRLALGCAESTARRLAGELGAAQRELRAFDEELAIAGRAPLALGSVQPLPVPGHCEIGACELELHPTGGHTPDGMAILIGWASVLAVGDYLSPVEIPSFQPGCTIDEYEATLTGLETLLERAEAIVPGHGRVLDRLQARAVLDQDLAYLSALRARESAPQLPPGRDGPRQRKLHGENLADAG
jgi:glyoxylase-like metal-dependent hydrolase (beta-lactamase superfamily II)